MSTRTFIILSTLGLCLVFIGAPGAQAGGGGDIATAPQVPIGQNVVGGTTCVANSTPPSCTAAGGDGGSNFAAAEYWRILALPADQLTIDYGSNDGRQVVLWFFAPSVTDYTLAQASPIASSETSAKNQLQFTFPSAGTWTLEVVGDGQSLSYQMSVYIKHYTHTAIAARPIVMHNAAVTYTGTVSGASGGQVELESRSLAHPVWKPFGLATIGANGSFKYKTKVAAAGTYRIQAVYPGDSNHLASSAIVSFKVI